MDPDLPFAEEAEPLGRCVRKVDKGRFAFSGAVIDTHDDFPAVGWIDHLEPAVQGEVLGGGGHQVRIVALPRGGAPAFEALCIV